VETYNCAPASPCAGTERLHEGQHGSTAARSRRASLAPAHAAAGHGGRGSARTGRSRPTLVLKPGEGSRRMHAKTVGRRHPRSPSAGHTAAG